MHLKVVSFISALHAEILSFGIRNILQQSAYGVKFAWKMKKRNKMFRTWIKNIVTEVFKENIINQPMIIASRAPTVDDIWEKGTTWRHGQDIYIAKKVTMEWEKNE